MTTIGFVWARDKADSRHGPPLCWSRHNLRAVRTVEVFDTEQAIVTQCPTCGARPLQIARCFKLHDGPPPVALADLATVYEPPWTLPVSKMGDEEAAEIRRISDAADAMGGG